VIAGLVDTSGYAADVREKYQGFLITDSPIRIGGSELGSGAYGFGFSNDGRFVGFGSERQRDLFPAGGAGQGAANDRGR